MSHTVKGVMGLAAELGAIDVYDIVRELEVSPSHASSVLAQLTSRGYLQYVKVERRRLYELTEKGKKSVLSDTMSHAKSLRPVPTWKLLSWGDG